MALTPAVELSYLAQQEQHDLLETMESEDCTPSLSQAQQMKRLSQAGELDADRIFAMLTEQKPNQREKLKIPMERIRGFFPKEYTAAQIEASIVKLCEAAYMETTRLRAGCQEYWMTIYFIGCRELWKRTNRLRPEHTVKANIFLQRSSFAATARK